jgi:hypothetical protein
MGNADFRQTLKDTCYDFSVLRKNLLTGQVIKLFSAYSIEDFVDKTGGF